MLRVLTLALATCAAGLALTVVGTIRDSSGAVVPGAAIDLSAEIAGQSFTAKAGPDGAFRVTGLSAGRYRIKISHPGFELYTQTVVVEENQTTAVDIRLEIAKVAADVLVTGKGGAANSDPNYRQLRQAELAETFRTENVTLKRDAGTITFKNGTISFGPPVLGKVTQAVFVGEGEFTLKPALFLETNHLKRVLNKESIQESFRQLVLVFTDDTYQEIRSHAGAAVAAESRAPQALREFRRQVRQRSDEPRSLVQALLSGDPINVDAETLADLYNPRQHGFFSAYITGRQHSHLRFHVKPRGALPGLPSPEEVAVINLDPEAEQEGIWYLCHSVDEIEKHTASPHEDKRTVSAQKYRIETAIGRNDHLTAVADFRFRAVAEGDRVIPFDLLPSLRVTRVTVDGQQEVPFLQEDRKADASFYVIMPGPMTSGRDYRLVIEYAGDRVIHKAGGGNFSVGARTSWYPSVNAFGDRAAYALTFKVPKDYTLVSVGKLVKESREGDFAVSQWVSDVPLAVAGFNYGLYKKKQILDEPTQYTIEGYAASEMPAYLKGTEVEYTSPSALTDRVLVETQNSLRIFERWFGKAPYGRIAMTQQPEFNFGQSWPGLVYLPMSAYLDGTQRWMLMGGISNPLTAFIQEVTPHEVSHQWWGHMVGWATFHDQWLSEGFADFSAGLYLQTVEPKSDKYWKFWERAREAILEKNSYGRSANDAGPLWMGLRLNTAKNPGAYNRLVYPKGGYILHMLRSMMWDPKTGDDAFIKMMREFVQSHFQQNASTESFKQVVDKHMTAGMDLEGNRQMDWFFAQWIYGTDIPRYKFDYTVAEASGGYVVKARLTQSEVTPAFIALVPVYGEFDGRMLLIGRVRITGAMSLPALEIRVPKRPKRVAINVNHDVLSR